jgi:hypothetical protein
MPGAMPLYYGCSHNSVLCVLHLEHASFMWLACLCLLACRSATAFEDIIENKQLLQVGLPTPPMPALSDANVAAGHCDFFSQHNATCVRLAHQLLQCLLVPWCCSSCREKTAQLHSHQPPSEPETVITKSFCMPLVCFPSMSDPCSHSQASSTLHVASS